MPIRGIKLNDRDLSDFALTENQTNAHFVTGCQWGISEVEEMNRDWSLTVDACSVW